jgi:hypothetical protein
VRHLRNCLIAAVAALATAAAPALALPGEPIEWPDEPPADVPFEASKRFDRLAFTGPYANHQPFSDTWYPSWGADDKLYTPFMDGFCNGVGTFGGYGASPAFVGAAQVTVAGDTPEAMAFRCTTRPVERAPYDGRYASASLHHDGVWYYGSYTLNSRAPDDAPACGNYCTLGPFVGFDVSHDDGLTWTGTPHTPAKPLFGETTEGGKRVKLGALHVVDFGKNMEHSPDGKMYLVGHGGGGKGSTNTWVNGPDVYLVRVTPSPRTVNDPKAYEFFAGRKADGEPIWSSDFEDLQPLLSWPNGRLGSATITYAKALDSYLMFTSAPEDGLNGRGRYDTMVLESKSITGPWRLVHYMPQFGPQGYFVNAPTKFISEDGSKLWLSWSANYGNDEDPGLGFKPFGSSYSWSLREFTLVPTKESRR